MAKASSNPNPRWASCLCSPSETMTDEVFIECTLNNPIPEMSDARIDSSFTDELVYSAQRIWHNTEARTYHLFLFYSLVP
jgi:hypothetical protein